MIDVREQQTSWRFVLCLLPEPVTVRVGDEVRLDATVDLRAFPVVHVFVGAVRRGGEAGAVENLGTTTLCLDDQIC